MGQYYTPVLNLNGKRLVRFHPHANFESAKITEHGSLGNKFVDSIMSLLISNPSNVMWVGDYTCEKKMAENVELNKYYEFSRSTDYDESFPKYTDSWDDYRDITYSKLPKNRFSECKSVEDYNNILLVNFTKKEYINFEDYIKTSKTKENGKYVLNPLCILTSTGNGQGGGDYFGINKDEAGRWAADSIMVLFKDDLSVTNLSIVDNTIEFFTKLDVKFKEEFE